MTVLLIGGPHNGRELKDTDICPDNNASEGPVRVLNVESKSYSNAVDTYTFLGEKESGVTEFLYHSSSKLS